MLCHFWYVISLPASHTKSVAGCIALPNRLKQEIFVISLHRPKPQTWVRVKWESAEKESVGESVMRLALLSPQYSSDIWSCKGYFLIKPILVNNIFTGDACHLWWYTEWNAEYNRQNKLLLLKKKFQSVFGWVQRKYTLHGAIKWEAPMICVGWWRIWVTTVNIGVAGTAKKGRQPLQQCFL